MPRRSYTQALAASLGKRRRKGHQIVERRLRRLERHGWEVLRDCVIPGSDVTLEYLAIGPAGAWYITVRAWGEPQDPVHFDDNHITPYCGYLSLRTDTREVCAIAGAISSALSGTFGAPVRVGAVMAVQGNPVDARGCLALAHSPATVLAVSARWVSWHLRRQPSAWSATEVTSVAAAARTALPVATG